MEMAVDLVARALLRAASPLMGDAGFSKIGARTSVEMSLDTARTSACATSRRKASGETGQVLLIGAVMIVPLLGFLGLAFDAGYSFPTEAPNASRRG
ncbi:MAG: hypothetical protein M3Z23_10160 [Acidobacteriota bacterium]|nr:hypothetical protein [Acidobacteriota bacterium]